MLKHTRNIQYNKYFTDDQIKILENEVTKLNQFIRNERSKIREDERYFMNFNFKDLRNHLEIEIDRYSEQIKINQIIDATNDLLTDFIDLLEKENFEKMYIYYIYKFIESIDHKKYNYREALEMFNEINNQLRKINQRLVNPENEITGENFRGMRAIMNKHRR